MRVAFGEGLIEIGGENEDLVVLTADVAKPTHVIGFGERFPHRFLNVGIAEQDMVDVAAGLALSEKVPVAVAFAPFMMRAWEQVRSTISRCSLNVKLVGTHAGLSASDEGASHQSLEDVALMRVLPNMTVVVPGDREEVKEATRAIVESRGPAYMRIGRDEDARFLEEGFRLGRAAVLRDGSDVVVFSNGYLTSEVLKAAEGAPVDAMVVHVPTVKPLDAGAVVSAARRAGAVICVEEHSVIGGLGSAVSELLSAECPVYVRRMGVGDTFGESGTYRELLEKHRLTAPHIREAMVKAAGRRGKR
ncbi:MAG: transketolase family protein [Candidatus Methanosuratincola verstraetei]|uniref:Transketolase, C-terminal section n=1 Tax=Methanosuratincola subterraneus TaxID=2593994 RepID=A0A444L778_METS7|nr:MAG: Transketolase, C-terminal section [Candidatus Methanosuratincola subterraneus]